MGIAMAFMVMTMASGVEARAKSDLGIVPSANAASIEIETESVQGTARLVLASTR